MYYKPASLLMAFGQPCLLTSWSPSCSTLRPCTPSASEQFTNRSSSLSYHLIFHNWRNEWMNTVISFTLINRDDVMVAEDFLGIVPHRADVAANQKRCLHHGSSALWSWKRAVLLYWWLQMSLPWLEPKCWNGSGTPLLTSPRFRLPACPGLKA